MDSDHVQRLSKNLDLRQKNFKGPKLAKEKKEMDRKLILYIEAFYPDVSSHKCFEKFKERLLLKLNLSLVEYGNSPEWCFLTAYPG